MLVIAVLSQVLFTENETLRLLKLFFLVVLTSSATTLKAQTATITGVVFDENQTPLPNVNIASKNQGTFSDVNGFYILEIIADQETTITFSHLGNEKLILKDLILNTNENYEFNPVLKNKAILIAEVVVTPVGSRYAKGITTISSDMVRNIPGPNAGAENILKLLPGVSSNNELSTQYMVRGGNFDENLVYVNDIEIYRPFLIRSGQQEGLSFINSDMIGNLQFSAGGFQAKYGDKLSSVLDISYKTAVDFGLKVTATRLGTSTTLESVSKNKKLSSLTSVRSRDNSLFVNSQNSIGNYDPSFFDIQQYTTYIFSNKLRLSYLGNISINNYRNQPFTRQTNFGTLNDIKTLTVHYAGNEKNQYRTHLNALKAEYQLNERTTLKLISSLYFNREQEYSDVISQYRLSEINDGLEVESPGEPTPINGLATQYNRARNDLDAKIFNLEHKGSHSKGGKVISWGLKLEHTDIRDQIRESEFIDSLGYMVRPPNSGYNRNEPEIPFEATLVPYEGIIARNSVNTNKLSGFVQYSQRTEWHEHNIYYNLGARVSHWTVNAKNLRNDSHTIFSPRAQFSIKPNWTKDMLFRLSGGVYQQPPLYRELRDYNGTVHPEVEAQKSYHLVYGNQYSFKLWQRPFTLNAEAYWKKMTHVNPYNLEDVRIRYAAQNNAKAYAYGAELRLNGAFVPGTESWFSLGYLKTEENINERGYISRPTDQRLKVGILFQDYMPEVPDLKMYLNLVYNTGLPGGSPSYTDPYLYQNRLKDYKRADLGISYIFVGANKSNDKNSFLRVFKDLSGGFEIFNLFNNQNSITNTWVRDLINEQQFAVPNFMTGRVLNIKIEMRF
ncbi:carboxypeptidase-like regulatory domain-containing protein [Arenibacter sp. M-2]|uniref:TonB-dependent receptor n=1 Tax=Arenibacter sp. M-2 TaxID=3053612 RepID=UPI00256FE9BF|nr:carboxypeptidase-like regulatory domain-containing protein [Arenibacter sp. M-2]MDL5511566.1 carboxypeptidase-like regulatory domain-containing protein [Arenibacter sp. M-2]